MLQIATKAFYSFYKLRRLLQIATNASKSTSGFFLKNQLAVNASQHWYPSLFGFLAILNALSPNNLSDTVLLGKSLKSLQSL